MGFKYNLISGVFASKYVNQKNFSADVMNLGVLPKKV